MDIRVRFAPSPTGSIHIGNIRTAIFNWLYARHAAGKFLLRIEDTDKERSTREAIDKLLECMEWLGLDYDEEIYYQSAHESEHADAARTLIEKGHAYHRIEPNGDKGPVLFRIPYNLDDCKNVRIVGNAEYQVYDQIPVEIDYKGIKFAQINNNGKTVETLGCLSGFKNLILYDFSGNILFNLNETKIQDILIGHKNYKLENCSKLSFLRREVFFKDLIKGELAKPLDSMKDLVIARSDNSPVFHLANVCDDIKQKATHIIRGDDHVENTYRHIFLFYALDYPIPQYAHMPMIVNASGKPYSKRDGDAFVGDFQEKGFLPHAMFNYLSLLGWSPGDNREKMSKADLIDAFTIDRVKSSPAQFDMNKLLNLNGLYMTDLKFDELRQLAYDETLKQGWGSAIDGSKFDAVVKLMQSRIKLISQVEEWKYFFFDESFFLDANSDSPKSKDVKAYSYDKKIFEKVLTKPENINGLNAFLKELETNVDFTPEIVKSLIHKAELSIGLQEGKLNQPVRVAITGKNGGADLFETIVMIGKDSTVRRLKNILK